MPHYLTKVEVDGHLEELIVLAASDSEQALLYAADYWYEDRATVDPDSVTPISAFPIIVANWDNTTR